MQRGNGCGGGKCGGPSCTNVCVHVEACVSGGGWRLVVVWTVFVEHKRSEVFDGDEVSLFRAWVSDMEGVV